MSNDYLETARFNTAQALGQALEGLGAPDGLDGQRLSTISACYRVLGLCALLQEADVGSFAAALCRAGQARVAFLDWAAVPGRSPPPGELLSSNNLGFADALASGDLATAREIAGRLPGRYQDGAEYEEDYCFSRFLHYLLLLPPGDPAFQALLDRWRELSDAGDGDDARLGVCSALLEQDADGLNVSFGHLLQRRAAEFDAYRKQPDRDPEVLATVANIYVDGLAICRLAEMRGLPPPPPARMVPATARIPARTPLPDQGAWRIPGDLAG